MKLIIVIEKIKDSSKRVKQAMFVTLEDKDGKTSSVGEVPKNSVLDIEFTHLTNEIKALRKEQKKALKTKKKTK